MIHVVLYQPAIPPNTGNVSRQCVGMRAHLHLIGPMKFEVSDNTVKRAGLDYWQHLHLTQHATGEDFLTWLGDRQPWLVTKFGVHRYDQPAYADEDILIFGNENTGLPLEWRERWKDRTIHIPIATHGSYVRHGADLGYVGLMLFIGGFYLGARLLLQARTTPDGKARRVHRTAYTLVITTAVSCWVVDRAYHMDYFWPFWLPFMWWVWRR